MVQAEVDRLKSQMTSERFYTKHIPAKQVLVSISDKPTLSTNDWIGYWEDVPLEDVKNAPAYKNTSKLKAATDDPSSDQQKEYDEAVGATDRIRLFKIWDLRTREKFVFAQGHDKELLRKPFKRCPLKFLRFHIDPYHFYPRPIILSKLGPQDEYNDSREYLRKIRKGTVPRYTYDEDAVDVCQLQKLESGEMGTYIPRKAGTNNPIEPVNQPSFSENAIQTLTLSDKEFADVGLAAACEILEQIGSAAGRRILVIGDGKLGPLVAQVLASDGAEVTIEGRHLENIKWLSDRGVRLGAGQGRYDVVVEATGSRDGLSRAIAACRPRGTLVLKSTIAGRHEIDLSPVVIDEITIVGSRCGRMEPALELLATRRVEVERMISARYPLREVERAFEAAGGRGVRKVIVGGD